MYTQCPNCSTVYRITTEQLKIAGGKVKCSTCAVVFNALNALGDHDNEEIDVATEDEIVEAPQETAAETESTEPQPALRQHDQEPIRRREKTPEKRQPPPQKTSEPAAPPPSTDAAAAIELEDLIDTKTLTPLTFVWLAGSIVLVLSLFVQYGYHNRFALAQDPETRESVETLCGYLSCELPALRSIKDITIKRRDVREQDSIPKTLLISLTIKNQAKFVQPYPEIQITLYDAQKNEIGARRFQPKEFITNQDMLERGMPPNTPTHIEFEVVAPQEETEGFTFDFY